MLYHNQQRLIQLNTITRLGLQNTGIPKLTFYDNVDVFESKYKSLIAEDAALNFAMCVIENNQFY